MARHRDRRGGIGGCVRRAPDRPAVDGDRSPLGGDPGDQVKPPLTRQSHRLSSAVPMSTRAWSTIFREGTTIARALSRPADCSERWPDLTNSPPCGDARGGMSGAQKLLPAELILAFS